VCARARACVCVCVCVYLLQRTMKELRRITLKESC